MIGKTLGHYQISSQLRKGGWVYQAKDQKLGRDVAIKVLPEEFARDADRIGRFEREAKLLASLNHPNVAAICSLGESGGTNFLVLELVEGQTLADQLKHGPIPEEPLSSPADRVFFPWSWSDNGKSLVSVDWSRSANIGILSTEGERKWKPLLEEKYNEDYPQISPDGRWISYVSDETGLRN
jgi:serine/threonine protein kinase